MMRTMRNRALFGVLVLVCGLAPGAAALSAQAKTPDTWVPERRADGHPAFHGVWANNSVTPLQRPKQWEGKERLTDAEVAVSSGSPRRSSKTTATPSSATDSFSPC